MGRVSKVAAIVGLTLMAAGVSGAVMADGVCRSTCDDRHVDCVKNGKSDDNVCLPAWRQCTITCATAKPVAAVSTPTAPTKVVNGKR